jgi:hypothetical protein
MLLVYSISKAHWFVIEPAFEKTTQDTQEQHHTATPTTAAIEQVGSTQFQKRE